MFGLKPWEFAQLTVQQTRDLTAVIDRRIKQEAERER